MKSFTQGAILIVDKSTGINCRAASSAAYENFRKLVGMQDKNSSASSSSRQHKKKKQKQGDSIKMGHAGTLDPMATGCLPVLLGQATKIQDHIPVDIKRYIAHLKLGVKTETDDADGKVVKIDENFTGISLNFDFEPILTKFRGKITQVPPIYSAIHVDGKRAYDLARAGETPTIPPREIEVYNFEAKVLDETTLLLDVTCGTGTYIRTLGTDLAKAIGTEGHLTKLRRVSSGPFTLPEDPLPLTQDDENVSINRILSLKEALETFALILDITTHPSAKGNLMTGRSSNLYHDIYPLLPVNEKPTDEVQAKTFPSRKIALKIGATFQALVSLDFAAKSVTSICHFKPEETFPFIDYKIQRNFTKPDPVNESELRFSQFNILANGLSYLRKDRGAFENVSLSVLNPDFRKMRIFEEIASVDPHIICLEENDFISFSDFAKFHPKYKKGVFIAKLNSPCLESSEIPDGCMVIYDTTRFVQEENELSFSLGGNQVAACLLLKDQLDNDKKKYLVCSAHFKSEKSEEGNQTRLQQAKVLCQTLKDLSEKFQADRILIGVDLNAIKTEPAYQHIRESFHSFFQEKEPEFTTLKKRTQNSEPLMHTIDYIFYSDRLGQLKPFRYLDFPSEEEIGTLPNWKYPSDHLMLCGAFET